MRGHSAAPTLGAPAYAGLVKDFPAASLVAPTAALIGVWFGARVAGAQARRSAKLEYKRQMYGSAVASVETVRQSLVTNDRWPMPAENRRAVLLPAQSAYAAVALIGSAELVRAMRDFIDMAGEKLKSAAPPQWDEMLRQAHMVRNEARRDLGEATLPFEKSSG